MESKTFSRKPVRKVVAYRNQYIGGILMNLPVEVMEYENGDLLQGTEKCQHVLSGDPSNKTAKRCLKKSWYVSNVYGHTLCPEHKAEEEGIQINELPL